MLKILFGLMCFVILCEATEYIFSYRIAVKNGVILNEKYYFSPSMVSANMLNHTKSPYKKCEIPHEAKSEKAFINDYKPMILECFLRWGVRLEDRSEVRNLKGQSVTFLSIPPTRIKIEYASGIATFYALIQDTKKTSFWESFSFKKKEQKAQSPQLENLESIESIESKESVEIDEFEKEGENEISHRRR